MEYHRHALLEHQRQKPAMYLMTTVMDLLMKVASLEHSKLPVLLMQIVIQVSAVVTNALARAVHIVHLGALVIPQRVIVLSQQHYQRQGRHVMRTENVNQDYVISGASAVTERVA